MSETKPLTPEEITVVVALKIAQRQLAKPAYPESETAALVKICKILLELTEPVKIKDEMSTRPPVDFSGTPHECGGCHTTPVYRSYRWCPFCGRPITWQ